MPATIKPLRSPSSEVKGHPRMAAGRLSHAIKISAMTKMSIRVIFCFIMRCRLLPYRFSLIGGIILWYPIIIIL